LTLQLDARYSTNAPGIAKALNLGVAAVVDESRILEAIASKMSPQTRWAPVTVR
jgi:hypothetical protein